MSNSILLQRAPWPPGERNGTNDDVAPSVDLLQMLIPPATGLPEHPSIQHGSREQEVIDTSAGYSSLRASSTGMNSSPIPMNIARIPSCYSACRACAEERYVRQQHRQRSDVILAKSSACCRCPAQSKPGATDDAVPGTSGPVYLNYFRFANGSTTTAGSSGIDGDRSSPVNESWSSLGRSRLWPPKTTPRGKSASLPRFGGNGRRLVSTAAAGAARLDYDFEDKDDYNDDDVLDVKRTGSTSKYARRNHLESTGCLERLISSASSLCCRQNHRGQWCNRKSTNNDRNNASVLVGGTVEPLDPKTTSAEDDFSNKMSVRWCRQDGPDAITTAESSTKVGRGRSGKTSNTSGDDRSRQHHQTSLPRYRRQTLFAVGFLVGLFIIAASLLTGFVVLWPPASLFGDRRRPSAADTPETGSSNNHHPVSASSPRTSPPLMHNSTPKFDYITVVPSLTKAIPDASGWVMFAGGSEKGSRYTLIDKVTTFYGGQERCQKLGGYLVHVNSLREQLFIEDFISQELDRQHKSAVARHSPGSSSSSIHDDGAVGYWLGAKRARGSHDGTCMYDQWKWVDSYGRALNTISGLTAFIPGKPDNYYSPEECLFLSFKDRTDENRFLKWDDAPCDLNSVGGIKVLCEVELR